jgi:UPF0755 protein
MKPIKKIIQNKKILLILGAILIVLVIFLIFLELVEPVSKGSEKLIVIEKGWGSGDIAQRLKDEDLIKSKWLFVFYAWVRGFNKHLQAGDYLLNPEMTLFKIAKIIARGEINPNWVKITIPEGWTNKQIEERLIEYGIIKSGDKLSKDQEGFLFPDTYYFYEDSSAEEIVRKMESNFNRKVTEDLRRDIERQKKTLYDVLIMASLLEKEVKSDEDKTIVSGIFWNRLKNKYPLESCATTAYILGVDKWRYSYEDTRIKSPYNTYLNIGLPPTPINNPGLSTIKAAIYPKETDYNFFLTDPETGKTIFSKTFEEHNANKRKYFY